MKYLALLLLGASLSVAQDKPAQTPPQPTTQPAAKPDTASVIKARLKAYQGQQKESLKLAKLQTKLQLEQLKIQKAIADGNRAVAVEQAKNN
jgi:hypothetical protein